MSTKQSNSWPVLPVKSINLITYSLSRKPDFISSPNKRADLPSLLTPTTTKPNAEREKAWNPALHLLPTLDSVVPHLRFRPKLSLLRYLYIPTQALRILKCFLSRVNQTEVFLPETNYSKIHAGGDHDGPARGRKAIYEWKGRRGEPASRSALGQPISGK